MTGKQVMLLEEVLAFLAVMVSIPALVYALQKICRRPLRIRKWVLLLIYIFLFDRFFDLIEGVLQSGGP